MTRALQIAILAGGQSRRFGTDKAMQLFQGESLLERSARTALATGLEVVVVGRASPQEWPVENVTFLVDEQPGLGPLGGIVTALRSLGTDILAVACDMPDVTVEAYRWLLAESERTDAAFGVATETPSGLEPLFSIYRQPCLALAEKQLAERRLGVRELLVLDGFHRTIAPGWVIRCLKNINTPEDLPGS